MRTGPMSSVAALTSARVGVAILAAGASTRMGRPKLLLPWGDTTVIGHLLTQWKQVGAEQIAVVCAEGHRSLHVELDRLGFPAAQRITNPAPEGGMFGSIQRAAEWPGWKSELSHGVICLGDQPQVRTLTLAQALTFAARRPAHICQPSRGGRPRHPVILPRAIFQRLREASEQSLKEFLRHQPETVALCELDDPGLDLDLDEPADYERALQLCRAAEPLSCV